MLGCVELTEPRALDQCRGVALSDARCPVLMLLLELIHVRKWVHRERPVTHTRLGQLMCTANAPSRRAYFQVLLIFHLVQQRYDF